MLLGCMSLAALLLTDLGPMLEAVSNRASAVNYFQDERGTILVERLTELQQLPSLFLFGRGFMVMGASDNSFLALLHAYGYLGALLALIGLLLTSGVARNKIGLHPQLAGIFIGIFFYLLTADVFGQAKIIGCFYCLVASRSNLKGERIPTTSRESLQ
jgi:hypothetical protein